MLLDNWYKALSYVAIVMAVPKLIIVMGTLELAMTTSLIL